MAGRLELIAEGFTAQIFRWQEGQVLKLYRAPFEAVAERECEVMRGLAGYRLRIPRVIQVLEFGGRTGYVMEEIRGPSLRDLLETDPASRSRYATALGRLHACVHACQIDGGGMGAVLPRIAHRIHLGTNLLGELWKPVCAALAGIRGGEALCHNDFHFGNVLQDAVGLWMVDWNGAGLGDAHADVGKSTVLMTHASVGICFGPQAYVRRCELTEGYLKAYRAERELDSDLLRVWQIVRAAELMSLRVPFAEELREEIEGLL